MAAKRFANTWCRGGLGVQFARLSPLERKAKHSPWQLCPGLKGEPEVKLEIERSAKPHDQVNGFTLPAYSPIQPASLWIQSNATDRSHADLALNGIAASCAP